MSIVALTSDTLVASPGAGQIEYNGQFFGTDSNASRAQMQRLVLATSQASTSGTSIDFTGLPAWVKRITVMFNGVSTNGSSNVLIQLGSGSPTTSGYLGAASVLTTGVASANYTTGLAVVTNNAASSVAHGICTIALITGNSWAMSGTLCFSNGAGTVVSASTIALSGTLDRVRITTVNGTDTFDAGSINILYEG
jgi:hypothetical protein